MQHVVGYTYTHIPTALLSTCAARAHCTPNTKQTDAVALSKGAVTSTARLTRTRVPPPLWSTPTSDTWQYTTHQPSHQLITHSQPNHACGRRSPLHTNELLTRSNVTADNTRRQSPPTLGNMCMLPLRGTTSQIASDNTSPMTAPLRAACTPRYPRSHSYTSTPHWAPV